MDIFLYEHTFILQLLLKHQVKFMLIGGYAVIHYGYNRTTGDMDLWLEPTNENKMKLSAALHEANFETEDLVVLENFDFTQHLVFSIGTAPQKMDFITRVSGVEYVDADQHKIIADIEELKLPIIHLNDLVLTKINTGRLQDKADIDELQRIRQNKK